MLQKWSYSYQCIYYIICICICIYVCVCIYIYIIYTLTNGQEPGYFNPTIWFSFLLHCVQAMWHWANHVTDITLHPFTYRKGMIIIMFVCLLAQSCLTFFDPMDYSPPGAFVLGNFSRQEYWSGLPCPPPGDFPNPGIEPRSLTLRQVFTIWATKEAQEYWSG